MQPWGSRDSILLLACLTCRSGRRALNARCDGKSDGKLKMKPLNNSMTATLFSLGDHDSSADEALLPSDALIIVIQSRPDPIRALPIFDWHHYKRAQSESLPIVRRKAERAYSQRWQADIRAINVSG